MKKKILIISIILIVIISMVSIFVFYKVQEDNQTLKVSNLSDTNTKEKINNEETKDENSTNEELPQKTEENNTKETNEEIPVETKEKTVKNTQDKINKNTNDNKKQETQKTNNQVIIQNNNKQEQIPTKGNTNVNTKEDPKVEEPKKETVKIDLSKYDRYEKALNGGYKAYKKDSNEMTKLKGLIDTCIKELGYKNVKLVPYNSKPNAQYFTANKTNVENKVYNSDGFTIYYYAEAEYHITAEGKESIFQYRSYIKVQ